MIEPSARFFEMAGYYRAAERIPPDLLDRMDRVIRDHLARSISPYRVNGSSTP
jgi:hypothetical protein